MSGLAFVAFVLFAYFLPVQGVPLFEYLHQHSRWPAVVGEMSLDYAAKMIGLWFGLTSLTRLVEHGLHRDDPRWGGLFRGFTRSGFFSSTDLLLAVGVVLIWRQHAEQTLPTYGLWPLVAAMVGALVVGPLLAPKAGPSANEAITASAKPPHGLPQAGDFDRLVNIARDAAGPDVATTTQFHHTTFVPPAPPDQRIGDEPASRIYYQIAHKDYNKELAKDMDVGSASNVARRVAECGTHPALLQLAYLVAGTPDQESRFRIKKVCAFVDGHIELAQGQPKRSPLAALYEGKATQTEKSWLLCSLLRSAGFAAALWKEDAEYGVALPDLASNDYLSGANRADPERETIWLLLPSGESLPTDGAQLIEVPEPLDLRQTWPGFQ